jgi:prevent-host-death family protein
MMRLIPASKAKNNFGEVIKRVYENEECQIIERGGIPVAAIVSMSDLERLYPEKVKELPRVEKGIKRQKAAQRLMAFLDEVRRDGAGFSEDEVERDVQKAVQEVRHGEGE